VNKNYFQSLLQYVTEDFVIRAQTKKWDRLPPSWTAGQLRKIEEMAIQLGHIPSARARALVPGAKRPSANVLNNVLFGTADKARWRRYAPKITEESEPLDEFEKRLREVMVKAIAAVDPGDDPEYWEREIEFWTPAILRYMAIYARGAAPLPANKFLEIVKEALAHGFIDRPTSDRIRYVTVLIYATKLALVEYCKRVKVAPRVLWANGFDAQRVDAIYRLAGFRPGRLPRVIGSKKKSHFDGLEHLLSTDGAIVFAFETTSFLRRDAQWDVEDSDRQVRTRRILFDLTAPTFESA
jgi:hypothetical protein